MENALLHVAAAFGCKWISIHHISFCMLSDIRLQLNEQLRCLDIRVESQISLIQELQEFYRRRGEVELDYSKSLEKLAKNLQLRHKEQKQKWVEWTYLVKLEVAVKRLNDELTLDGSDLRLFISFVAYWTLLLHLNFFVRNLVKLASKVSVTFRSKLLWDFCFKHFYNVFVFNTFVGFSIKVLNV